MTKAWVHYERGGASRWIPTPHRGTHEPASGTRKKAAVVVKHGEFGFGLEEWGEARWTARDLRR